MRLNYGCMLQLHQLQKYQPALPRSRNVSMMGLSGSTSTVLAWEQALGSLKKSLPSKDLKRLQLPVSPADLVSSVETWLASNPRKAKKAVNVMGQTVSRIQRFSSCVDQLAQGSPAPATLLWGSIKFVLTVFLQRDHSRRLRRVRQSLSSAGSTS